MIYSNSQQVHTGINFFAFRERYKMKQDRINEIYAQLQKVFDDYSRKAKEKKARMESKRLPGTISGPLQIFSGGAGVALFGGLSLGFAVVGAAFGTDSSAFAALMVILCSVFLPLTAISGFLLGRGILTKNRVERLKKYLPVLSGRSYMMLEDLAMESGQPMKRVGKDAHYLLDHNLLPGAQMDQQETCLLLSGEAIEQYEYAMEARRIREEEDLKKQQQIEQWDRIYDEEDEMHDFVIRGEDYLSQLDEYLVRIYCPEVKTSLERLSLVLRQIFVCVKEHPEKVRLTRQLMNYYIPSTIKLLSTYDDLEKQPIQGDNIKTTRKEIESSLITISDSLENMFDELFQEEALDISSDIQVLNAILKRDGWKQN